MELCSGYSESTLDRSKIFPLGVTEKGSHHSHKKTICMNCGKNGHESKSCNEPITSLGIIDIKILGNSGENLLIREQFSKKNSRNQIVISRKYPHIRYSSILSSTVILDDRNSYCINDLAVKCDTDEELNKFCYYRNKIIFLMVSRKFSLGFIEFIRGKYNISDTRAIIDLFEQMTPEEIKYIHKHKHNYNDILYYFLNRNDESKEVVLNRIYEGKYSMEYCEAKMKFDMLRGRGVEENNDVTDVNDMTDVNDVAWGLDFYTKTVKPRWKKPEWGFPKGRRDNRDEENLTCACREFEEETGYNKNNYLVLGKIKPIEEQFIGTNNVRYKHIYNIAIDLTECNTLDSLKNYNLNNKLEFDRHEIGDIGWFTYDEAIYHIRPYHTEKKKILTQVYLFILNYLIKCQHL